MARGQQIDESLESVLANDIANFFYQPLVEGTKQIVAGRLNSSVVASLKEHAVKQWRRTVARCPVSAVAEFIEQDTIPSIERSSALLDQIFVLFFFVDPITGRKRFWLPGDPETLKRLGRPYSQPLAVHGTSGIAGLKTWEVPLTSHETTGIRGNLTHQHVADLTEDQFEGKKIYNPIGDWLVGIKTVVFIAVPDVQTPDSRVGQVCICSPVPGLFGDKDWRETEPGGLQFFRPYIDFIDAVRPVAMREFPSFPQYFEIQARYRTSGAAPIARNWIFQTIGLRHRNSIEAEYIAETGYMRIKRFLDFIEAQPAWAEIRNNLDETTSIAAVGKELELIRDTELSRLRFYNFLSRFGRYALGDREARSTADTGAPTSTEAFAARIKSLVEQIRLIRDRRSAADLDITISDDVIDQLATVDWGALEFILHQLLQNADDKGSGEKIDVAVAMLDGKIIIEVSNNILCLRREKPGVGGSCGCDSASYVQLGGDGVWRCRACLDAWLKQFFGGGACWVPELNGKRFGLFMIRNFIENYFGGHAGAVAGGADSKPRVTFMVAIDPALGREK